MDEEQLVQGLRSQDPGAVQELVVSYGDRLFRSACLLCGDQAEAQDLVQETLLQAVRSARRFGGRSSIYTLAARHPAQPDAPLPSGPEADGL